MMTEKAICERCYELQNASNFYPIAKLLPETIKELNESGIEYHEIPRHPAIIILVDKILDMMNRPDMETIMDAFHYCKMLSEET